MAELRIPIISEFKGQNAFNKANKATSTLEKSTAKLGKALLAAFSVQKITQFGKAAAKAFIEDEKAASRLAQSVKNLGLAFEIPNLETFISQMANASGVTDDQLRPSLQRLLQTTGSVTKSTELLTQALDISRGSGVDYETVVNDLTMAYVGQTRGLRKYSLGLSQAELKTMSFADVQEKLTKQFSGANAQYLTTYAGKMGILSNAASEATENIGKGLVESLSLLGGDGNTIQPLADSMLEFSTEISNAITGIAVLINKIKAIPGIDFLVRNLGTTTDLLPNTGILKGAFKALSDLGKEATPGMGGYPSSALGPGYIDPNDAARKKAEAAAVKRAKELAALQKKTLDTQKKQNALTRASKTLNLEAIGIEAALKGQISETDRLSLLLQKAILGQNVTLATQLSDQLEAAIKRQNDIRNSLLTTPEAPNPYRNWTLPQDLLNYTASSLGVSVAQLQTTPIAPSSSFSDAQMELMAAVNSFQGANQQAINVEVYLDGSAVGGAVTNAQVNQSLSGTFSDVSRYNGRGLRQSNDITCHDLGFVRL
jgi:hypothetical protein